MEYHAYYDTVMESQRQKLVVEEEKKERERTWRSRSREEGAAGRSREVDSAAGCSGGFEKRRQVDEVIARFRRRTACSLRPSTQSSARRRTTSETLGRAESVLKREKEEEEERRTRRCRCKGSEANPKRRQMNAQDRILDKLRSLKEKEWPRRRRRRGC